MDSQLKENCRYNNIGFNSPFMTEKIIPEEQILILKSRFMDLHWQLIEMALMKDFLEAAKTSLFFSFFLFFLIQAVINSIYDISIQKFPV